jgi:hypothetical protein
MKLLEDKDPLDSFSDKYSLFENNSPTPDQNDQFSMFDNNGESQEINDSAPSDDFDFADLLGDTGKYEESLATGEGKNGIMSALGNFAGIATKPSITATEIMAGTKPTDMSGYIKDSYKSAGERDYKNLMARYKMATERNKAMREDKKLKLYEQMLDAKKVSNQGKAVRENKQTVKELFRDQKTIKGQFNAVQTAYDNIVFAAKTPGITGLSQISSIYNLIKLYDPNAVKEGEIALVRSSVPGASWIDSLYNKIVEGKPLPPVSMKELLKVAAGAYNAYKKTYVKTMNEYETLAKSFGIPDELSKNLRVDGGGVDTQKDYNDIYLKDDLEELSNEELMKMYEQKTGKPYIPLKPEKKPLDEQESPFEDFRVNSPLGWLINKKEIKKK